MSAIFNPHVRPTGNLLVGADSISVNVAESFSIEKGDSNNELKFNVKEEATGSVVWQMENETVRNAEYALLVGSSADIPAGTVKAFTESSLSIIGEKFAINLSSVSSVSTDSTQDIGDPKVFRIVFNLESVGYSPKTLTWDYNDEADRDTVYGEVAQLIIAEGGSVPVKYWIVDPLNGDDATGEFGSTTKPFATIAGAEAGALSGDYIKIVSDVQECGMGKDGITYIIDKGVKVYFPKSEATPGDLNTAHLWSDYRAGTAISFEVYGGYHEAEGNWFGPSDRGIIRNNFGSNIKIYKAEKIFAKGTSQDFIVAQGTGGNTEIHCDGDIISGLNGLQLTGAVDSTVVVKANGKIQTELRMIAVYSGAEGNKVLFEAGTEIISLGHSISTLRSTLYGNTGNASNPEHWILKAPRITYYDPYPNLGSNNGAFLFGWQSFNLKLDIVAEILTMSNVDPATYTNEAGLLALNYGGSAANYDVRLDVGTIVLGKGHEFDDTSYTPGRTQSLVKLKNCEIVTMSDVSESGNVIDTNYYIPTFEGACKLIINPLAIAAGQKAIGSSGGNDAWVMGYVITNGDYFDANFTDKFSGNVGAAITNIKVLDASEVTDFTKYENIL